MTDEPASIPTGAWTMPAVTLPAGRTGSFEILGSYLFPPTTPQQRSRSVFVAYAYKLPKADYRKVFRELAKAFNVEFEFADQKITNKHVLEKLRA